MRILIVGGGMGGTILANNLARRLVGEVRSGKAKITMLSASDKHMYQPGLLYTAFGRITPDELYRDQAGLLEPGVEFIVDPVTEFNLDQNRVKAKSGTTTPWSSRPDHGRCRRRFPGSPRTPRPSTPKRPR